jgi:flagellar secretion chaperone FliS
MANPFSAYLESRVLTASPLHLVHLAYEGAMEAIAEARRHLSGGSILERSQAITKAQMILAELQSSLDFGRGGDLSRRLAELYDYMQRRLNDANFQQSDEPLAEVYNLLETVDSAWRDLASSQTSAPVVSESTPSAWMASEAPVYSRSAYTL